MLEEYKDRQPIAYDLMISEIKSNQLSHAYLFDTNNDPLAFNIVISFVKEILCMSINDAEGRIISERIDQGNYPEVKIIEPDGMIIKKKQILDLQQEFSRMAVEGSKRIYIIKDADKMRTEAANSMLKFLEEPDSGIIAILLTNNFNNMLSTIISRCQVIRFNSCKSENDVSNVINEVAINFVISMEDSVNKTILNEKELLYNYINIKNREEVVAFFDKVIDVYYDIMKLVEKKNSDIKFNNYIDKLVNIADKNSINEIMEKINYLIDAKESIKYNVNIGLLIDSVVFNVGGIYESSWN